MVHGLPDGALSGKGETIFSMFDAGELAVRLGSIVSFNREGNVIFLDDFSHTLSAWVETTTGGIADVYPVCNPTMHGGIAILLKTGAAEDTWAEINHILYYPGGASIGLEVSFVPVPEMKYLFLRGLFFDGDNVLRFRVRYNHENGELRVYTDEDTYAWVATPGIQREGYGCFVTMKLVGNIVTKKYTRIIFNGEEYDASTFPIYEEPDDESRSMAVLLRAVASDAGSAEVVVDNVIVTQNEPA